MPPECARSARPVQLLRGRQTSVAVVALLVLMSVWAVSYELADTLVPAIGDALPFQGIAPDVVFALAGLLLVAKGLRGERGWALIGVGALCWAAGDVYWTLQLSYLSSPPVPSWADAGYLLFCPLAFVGILSLVHKRAAGAPNTLVADACAATLAVGALGAATVVQPVLAHAQGGTLAVATNLAYPLVDLLLLGLIVVATALGNWKLERTWVLLGASVVVFCVADSLYLIADATGTYQQTAWFNPLWYASPVMTAWAAWLRRGEVSQSAGKREDMRGIVMSLVFACAALGTLVWSSFSDVGVMAIVLATASLLVIMARLVLTWRENTALLRRSQREALTDALTELGNRRALMSELERRMGQRSGRPAFMLALFDLDGFKHYNDHFGHPAGDTLLQRLGRNLQSRLRGGGTAYRMGGDEFCVLIDGPDALNSYATSLAAALTESGKGFAIGCSYGSVLLPGEAQDTESALRLADQRMYAQKRGGRASASRQSKDVLMRALAERNPELGSHLREVAELAFETAARFSLPADEVKSIRLAGELHDVGKVAIPDAILQKPGPLNDEERAFIRRHTLIGERIISAAPALRQVAALVRSSHENFDGSGYPDGLAGEEIPLGSRIIAVCDAFNAMMTDRPYRRAMDDEDAVAELRRCAGSQFDPAVVERFCDALAQGTAVLHAA